MIRIEHEDIGLIEARLRRFSGDIVGKSLMSELAQFGLFKIKQRTARGDDADNNAFKPYSDAYKLFREEAGHAAGKVNLLFNNHMLSAMDHRVISDTTAELFFNNPHEAAKAHGHHYGHSKGSSRSVTVKAHERKTRGGTVHVKRHQREQCIPWGDVPKRSFFALNFRDMEEMEDMINRHLIQRRKKHGLK